MKKKNQNLHSINVAVFLHFFVSFPQLFLITLCSADARRATEALVYQINIYKLLDKM